MVLQLRISICENLLSALTFVNKDNSESIMDLNIKDQNYKIKKEKPQEKIFINLVWAEISRTQKA